ncbi:hypothetical protein [Mesorhizobium sp.]|uniref:hypothetical protein n=1 Tax=Mesorhizobium sp. TaxID=1871066 RepID=UPI001208C9DA|nr:hypothetical protein [Mesorhizobium sp.]TIO72113.1 MAG: hypothetical protein E5X75_33695 [Mesorhizobium sp.]
MKRVWIIFAALIALCLAMIVHLSKAHAQGVQVPCDRLKTMLDRLAQNYGEFVAVTGTLTNGKQIIITLSASGSFSFVETDGNVGCMVAAGEKAELDKGI